MAIKISLQVKACGQNLSCLRPSIDKVWKLVLKSNSGNLTDASVSLQHVNAGDGEFPPKGRNKKGRSRTKTKKKSDDNTALVKLSEEHLLEYDFLDGGEEDSGWQTVCIFTCTNCTIQDLELTDGWQIVSLSDEVFENVDLSQNDWYDMDSAEDLVSLTEIEYRLSKKTVTFVDESEFLVHYIENCLYDD